MLYPYNEFAYEAVDAFATLLTVNDAGLVLPSRFKVIVALFTETVLKEEVLPAAVSAVWS